MAVVDARAPSTGPCHAEKTTPPSSGEAAGPSVAASLGESGTLDREPEVVASVDASSGGGGCCKFWDVFSAIRTTSCHLRG